MLDTGRRPAEAGLGTGARPLSREDLSILALENAIVAGQQLEDGVLQTPETPPELPGQYYAFANTMVEYLYKTYGTNAYWDLMTAYKAGVDANVNLPKVIGVTPTAFYASWLVWAKTTYC